MDVVIRELVGVEEIASIYPLYRQSGSLPEEVFHERLVAMLAQGGYRSAPSSATGWRRPTMWLSTPRCAVPASAPD